MSSRWPGRQCESKQHSGQPRAPRGLVAAAQMGADASTVLRVGTRRAAVPPTAAVAQIGANAPAATSTEIVAFTGGRALPPWTVPWSPWDPGHCQGRRSRRWVAYPHQDQLRRVGHGDEGTALGVAHVGSISVRRRRLLRGLIVAGCPHCCSPARDTVLAFQEVDCQGGLGCHRCGTYRQRSRPQDHTTGTSQGVGEPGLHAR
jgi:hypothetical protein